MVDDTPLAAPPLGETPSPLDLLRQQTWCLVDGEGGYVSGNALLLPDTLSQGLLVKATQPPVGRFLLLARLEESLIVDGVETFFSVQRYYPEVLAHDGPQQLLDFVTTPFPTWTYSVAGVEVQREIGNVRGTSLVGVTYRVRGAQTPVILRVRPLLAFRRIDQPTFQNPTARVTPEIDATREILRFSLYDSLPSLHLSCSLPWQADAHWYRSFHYPELPFEHQREDLCAPGFFEGVLLPEAPAATLVAATTPVSHREFDALRAGELARPAHEVAVFPARGEGEADTLVAHLSDFLAVGTEEEQGAGVLPSLPEATHDGRAALLGLRGLCLVPGRYDLARKLLTTVAEEYGKGLIPSHHDEWEGLGDVSGYDTLLWFPSAVYSYLLYTDDLPFIRSRLFWTLVEIGGQIQRGLPGLRMDRVDSLLVVGEDERPHTWMNAVHPDGAPVTLRRGKTVELNALWYNACEALKEISAKLGRSDLMRSYRALAARIRETFPVLFWNPRARCLYDVVDEEVRDESIRPNQLFTLSLPFQLIEGDRAASMLEVVRRELLTPYGLRTLSPRSPGYAGTEAPGEEGLGGEHLRHQGSVYPWLLGPFVSAWARLHGSKVGFGQQLLGWLEQLLPGDPTALPGHLRERYDGDAPHAPRGPRSSALATAELLRCFAEELQQYPAFNIRPVTGLDG